MHVLHLDTETHPVTQDDPSPPPICLQWCVGLEPEVRTGAASPFLPHGEGGLEFDPPVGARGEGFLVDEDPSWRWPQWSMVDLLGPAPDGEATEDDDPAEDFRACKPCDLDLEPVLLAGDDILDGFRWALEETDLLLCGVNIPYDLLVLLRASERRGLPLWRSVLEALAAGRLRGTDVSEKLLCIALGREEHRFGMEGMAHRYLGLDLGSDKHGPGAWRVRYRELERWPGEDEDEWLAAVKSGAVTREHLAAAYAGDLPLGGPRDLGTWPYHARRYALQDVVIDREIWRRQRDVALRLFGAPRDGCDLNSLIPDEVARPVFQFALHLQSTTGVRTDYQAACAARTSLADASDRLMAVLVKAGLVRRKEIWTGEEAIKPGAVLTSVDRPGETFRFVERVDAKGAANPRGRSATVTREEDGTAERLPVTGLHLAAEMGEGLHLSRDMAEVRRRVEATLRDAGYADHGQEAEPDPLGLATPPSAAFMSAWKELPRTETGLVKTDREVLDLVCGMADDAGLKALGALGKVQKLASTYVIPLCCDRTVRWRYDVLKDTGRTSASALRFFGASAEGHMMSLKEGTNFQNFPGGQALERTARALAENLGLLTGDEARDAAWARDWVRRHDPRRMVRARPGRLFANHDYKAIELGCMARVLNVFGKSPSSLAAVVNSGKDAHLWTGVRVHPILHCGETLSYEALKTIKDSAELGPEKSLTPKQVQVMQEARAIAAALGSPLAALQKRVSSTRKMCKVVNFGFLGAMGAAKFILYAFQGYGVRVEMDVAKALRKAFLDTYPEVRDYFERVSDLLRRSMPVVQIGTGRVRRVDRYAAACNSYFQGLAADGGAQAAWLLLWQSKVGPGPLFDTQADPLIFEHDAFLVEFLSEAAEEWQWLDAEIEAAALRGASNDSGIILLSERREVIRKAAQDCAASAEVGRLMVAGMDVYLKDERRPELSVRSETDGKVSTRWEK